MRLARADGREFTPQRGKNDVKYRTRKRSRVWISLCIRWQPLSNGIYMWKYSLAELCAHNNGPRHNIFARICYPKCCTSSGRISFNRQRRIPQSEHRATVNDPSTYKIRDTFDLSTPAPMGAMRARNSGIDEKKIVSRPTDIMGKYVSILHMSSRLDSDGRQTAPP